MSIITLLFTSTSIGPKSFFTLFVSIGESLQKGGSPIEETKVKKDLGPVEVDVKKSMIVDTKSDESSVKLDEKIKGKVKTQKDKLRNLRK